MKSVAQPVEYEVSVGWISFVDEVRTPAGQPAHCRMEPRRSGAPWIRVQFEAKNPR